MRASCSPHARRRRYPAWLAFAALVLAVLLPPGTGRAQAVGPPIACPGTDGSPADALERLRGTMGGLLTVLPVESAGDAATGTLNLLPASTDVRLVVRPDSLNGWSIEDPVVVAAVPKAASAERARGLHVTGASRAADGAVHLRVRLDNPPGGWFWASHDLLAIGCLGDRGGPAFVARTRMAVSTLVPSAIAAVVAVVLFYAAGVFGARHRLGRISVDPIQITAGVDGRGSISKLQILFFTLIVAGLLVYVLLRVGRLGDLSTDVLLLLGISGVGGAAAKQASVMRRRIASENWSWLQRQGWEPPKVKARWGDLVMEGAEFDVYRFQILIFSLVVGGALLFTGVFGLANFELPEALLALLGLSQVVYLGGKVVAKPETAELNKTITALRERAGEAAGKARGAGGDPAAYDYRGVSEAQGVQSAAADVQLLTVSLFGGKAPKLTDKLPHELI